MIKKNILLTKVFKVIDPFLPRSIAVWPYQESYYYLLSEFQNKQIKSDIWIRNSVRLGNFIFGVSDLDLTVYSAHKITNKEIFKIKTILKEAKNIYPFIGECNFYNVELSSRLLSSANPYELKRDPELIKKIDKELDFNNLEKTIFLLRMLYADHQNLIRDPMSRLRKWNQHFQMLDLPVKESISFNIIIEIIIDSINDKTNSIDIRNALNFLKTPFVDEDKIYHATTPPLWKFLFPHKHLWFEREIEDFPEEKENTVLGNICLRQIDWEIWGLMTQLPEIKDKEFGLKLHLNRLSRVASRLNPKSDIPEKIQILLNN